MNRRQVLDLAEKTMIPLWMKERQQQTVYREWARGKHVKPFKPADANPELEALLDKSPTPLIMLIVRILAQTMEMQSYTPGIPELRDPLWRIWQGNRMQTRQKRLYKAALWGGQAYALALPADPVPQIKIFSGRNMVAVYQDAEADEWPTYAAYSEVVSPNAYHFNIVDDGVIHRLGMNANGSAVEYIEERRHNVGILPVVRYAGEVDDEGAVMGEVEPLIPIQSNIDQTNYDRLMTQSFEAWAIRYITGMAKPQTESERDAQRMVLERNRLLLVENEDAKVGRLDGSALEPYITARRDSKQDLAAVAQVSQKTVLGAQSNNADGAEAQAAEEASTQRKTRDYTVAFGESHCQLFRLTGQEAGLKGAWTDYGGTADWVNSEIRSMSQVADALGKFASQLGIPAEGLWEMVPGVSPERIERWKAARAADPLAQLAGALEGEDVAFRDK